jgi:hypothetical protein
MIAAPTSASRQPGRVVILCSTAWGIRNVVLSGVLDALRGDLDVQLLTSDAARHALSERCDAEGQEPLCKVEPRRHDPLGVLLNASFTRRHQLQSFSTFQQRLVPEPLLARRAWRHAVSWLAVAGAWDPVLAWQIAADQRRAGRLRGMDGVRSHLRSLAPNLVVSTASVVPDEAAYIRAAAELGIPTLGCILSFDNLSSRGRQPSHTHYAVWGQWMREQVLRLYPDCPPSHVHITGTPQFDLHRRAAYTGSRGQTLARLGLATDERYVLYAANCARFTPTEPALVAEYCHRLAASPALRGHRVVLRPHPADDVARWQPLLTSVPGLVLSTPHGSDGRFGTVEAQAKLVGSVAHADVCVNMASTMSLDAAVLDVPVVCVGFALTRGSTEDRLAAACHATTHYAPVVASGAVRLARSLDELVQETIAYVRDGARDSVERRRLVSEMCGPADDAAGARLARLVRQLAGVSAPMPGDPAPRPGALATSGAIA